MNVELLAQHFLIRMPLARQRVRHSYRYCLGILYSDEIRQLPKLLVSCSAHITYRNGSPGGSPQPPDRELQVFWY